MKRSNSRRCSRASCTNAAIKTLTYIYSDSTAVLGPLATYAEPHNYDLCADHSERLTVPVGWNVIKLYSDSLISKCLIYCGLSELVVVLDPKTT